MKKKLIVLIITLLSSIWLNAQEAVTTSESVEHNVEVLNHAHQMAKVKEADKKTVQPFWSDQQIKQAELEKKVPTSYFCGIRKQEKLRLPSGVIFNQQ